MTVSTWYSANKRATKDVVADVAYDEVARGYRLAESFHQVVEDHDALAGLPQLPHHMTADVAGTAGHQNRPVIQNHLRSLVLRLCDQSSFGDMAFEPFIGLLDARPQRDFRLPPESAQAGGVQ